MVKDSVKLACIIYITTYDTLPTSYSKYINYGYSNNGLINKIYLFSQFKKLVLYIFFGKMVIENGHTYLYIYYWRDYTYRFVPYIQFLKYFKFLINTIILNLYKFG